MKVIDYGKDKKQLLFNLFYDGLIQEERKVFLKAYNVKGRSKLPRVYSPDTKSRIDFFDFVYPQILNFEKEFLNMFSHELLMNNTDIVLYSSCTILNFSRIIKLNSAIVEIS